MLPQFTVYAKILCLLMVVMGALSTTLDTTLISGCSGKAIQMDSAGRVFASDQHQKVTLTSHIVTSKHGNITTHITLYFKEQQKFICFSKRWKLVGLKKKRDKRCYFQETMKNGNFQYQSIIDGNKFIGFRKNGKPIHYDVEPKNLDANCLSFLKLDNKSSANGNIISHWEMLDDARADHGMSHSKTNNNKRKQLRRQEGHRPRVNQIKHNQNKDTGRFEKKVVRYSAHEATSSIPLDPLPSVRSLDTRRGSDVTEKRHGRRKELHRHLKHHPHSEQERTHFSLEQYSSDVVRSLHNDPHRHSGSKHGHRKFHSVG
uniref:Putative secreted protein n=1 Tax=Lutzomyia longipalpis TaxID=7200 RepID=A0A7G3AM46_LUTLO